jgi:hypothetical protein
MVGRGPTPRLREIPSNISTINNEECTGSSYRANADCPTASDTRRRGEDGASTRPSTKEWPAQRPSTPSTSGQSDFSTTEYGPASSTTLLRADVLEQWHSPPTGTIEQVPAACARQYRGSYRASGKGLSPPGCFVLRPCVRFLGAAGALVDDVMVPEARSSGARVPSAQCAAVWPLRP